MKLKIAFDPDLVALMQAEIAAGERQCPPQCAKQALP